MVGKARRQNFRQATDFFEKRPLLCEKVLIFANIKNADIMQNRSHFATLVYEQARKYGSRTALAYRDYDLNKWIPVSWNDFAARVKKLSLALLRNGVGVQENVATFSQNKPECMYCDFGAYGIRAVTVPFYPTSSVAQVSYMVQDASVRVVFVGEQQQYDVAWAALALCPTLEKIVIFDRKVARHPNDVISTYFDDFINEAETETEVAEWQRRQAAATESDLANILYTSGTTGRSKGVMLTHAMYREALRVNDAVLDFTEKDVVLNFLPLTHVFERAWSYLGLSEGAVLYINLRPADVQQSIREVRPTCMCSVPRFWEKVYQGVQEHIEKSPLVQRKLMRSALQLGMRCWEEYGSKRKKLPLTLALQYKLYDKTVFALLRKTLGLDRGNFFPTAGAAVSPEVEKFAHAVGINMIVGYGLTESTATVSCDHGDKPCTLGSVGRLIDGIEIKIGENNEILLRGKTITPGYYNKVSTTAASLDADGWFHTGDAGYMKDGELYLTERIKDLFKTSNGKYIAPQAIETKLTVDRFFDQVVVIANERKFVSALIVPNYQLLEQYAADKGIAYGSREALCKEQHIIKMLARRIELLQQDLANYEKVKRFLLLPTPFSIESGELTNTLKVKRAVVNERYKEQIDRLYAEAEKDFGHKG